MKQLVEITGINRQTIHTYLRERLLPPAVEGAGTRNARYGEAHVELLSLIREIREARGMSLEAIRRAFALANYDPAEARRMLAGQGPGKGEILDVGPPDLIGEARLLEEAGVGADLLAALSLAGVLAPNPDDAELRYDREAVAVLAAAARLEAAGLGREQVVRLASLGSRIANQEAVALVGEATRGGVEGEEARRRAEVRHRRVSELAAAVRVGALRAVTRRLAGLGAGSRSFLSELMYIPSPLFIRRFRIEQEMAATEALAMEETDSAQACRRLGRMLLGLGRYQEAELWLSRSVLENPSHAETHAYLGLARATAGHLASAVESCRRAIELRPDSARAHAFLGVALGLQAALAVGLDDPEATLADAVREVDLSRTFPVEDDREAFETLVVRGRLFTILGTEAAGVAAGVADLEEVLARTRGGGEIPEVDYPGSNTLYRINALFFLGVSAHRRGDRPRAARLLNECITLDPSSRMAELAYDHLAEAER